MPDFIIVIAIAVLAVVFALAAAFVLFAIVPRKDPKLASLEGKSEPRPLEPVDAVSPLEAANREAAELMKQGKKIEAIKVYREKTGVGLAEAKAAVERL